MPTGEGQPAAPTGCFKCGRPGHWSRDCPSSSATNSNPNPTSDSRVKQPSEATTPAAAAKKPPRSRPKLTPEILLSENGLGYVLQHFPRAFKYHGRNHEVEQVGASRRVKRCIDELRERVARGGDPTKLHEAPVELDDEGKEPEQCGDGGSGAEETILNTSEDPPMEGHGQDHVQEDMINEIYQMAVDTQPQDKSFETQQPPVTPLEQMMDGQQRELKAKIQITEEQRTRMEANRSKALERAKLARASLTAH